MNKSYQVVGIGNAVSDVISHATDAGLAEMGIEKGIMQLIERDRAEVLYAGMTDRVETPGGSVANTLAGIGVLGGRTAFIGRVADDALGKTYAATLAKEGTAFPNPPVADAALPTSRSMIFVSPDGERSMNTYLGISSEVSAADVPQEVVRDCEVLFLEGYLFDKNPGKEAFRTAADAAVAAGAQAGISLSDPFCVDRHRDDFRALIRNNLSFVIGNQAELTSLYQVGTVDAALDAASQECGLVVCTRSGDGVSIRAGSQRIDIPVTPVVPVDATGAGDQFAAGFIYGMITGAELTTCGRMGCVAAAEVISHIGPRPMTDMAELFRKEGLV